MIIIVPTAGIQYTSKMLFFPLFFSSGAEARIQATFGQGRGPIFLDNVGCNGTELLLTNCTNLGVGVHNCAHFEDAGVVCAGI